MWWLDIWIDVSAAIMLPSTVTSCTVTTSSIVIIINRRKSPPIKLAGHKRVSSDAGKSSDG